MRNSILLVGALFLGTTFAASTVVAQSGTVSGSIVCNAPGYEVEWSVTWDGDPPEGQIMACYMPDYEYQSAEVYYVPGPGQSTTSDGSETVPHVPQYEGENDEYELYGVWCWYEWGEWINTQYGWIWYCYGYTDPCFLPRPGSCFAAGTLVLTPDGSKPIEQFKAGDLVLSSPEDDPNASPVACRVQDVIRTHAKLVNITVNGKIVRATREHPFYVKDRGWVNAASLTSGDLLRRHDNRWLPVTSVVDAEASPVFNLRIEKHKTYFVGSRDWKFSLWVYSECDKPKSRVVPLATAEKLPRVGLVRSFVTSK